MRVFTTVLIVMAAAAVIMGCNADEQAGCDSNAKCAAGQYCGPNGKCTLDCRVDSDCANGKVCSALGQCVNPSQKNDMGVASDQGSTIHHDDGVPLQESGAVLPDDGVAQDQGGSVVQDDGVPDNGGVKLDQGGGVKLDQGGGVKLDQGGAVLDGSGPGSDTGGAKVDGWGGPDGGTSGSLNCAGIASCAAKCSTTLCIQKCTCLGTVPAQNKYKALTICIQNASAGSCAAPCVVPGSSACGACVQKVCDAEYKKCQFGPPIAGFGDVCSQSAPCNSSHQCAMTQAGSKVGFCSKQCTKTAAFCTGVPTGTEAYCMLSTGSAKYCVFLCKYTQYGSTVTVPCPTKLTCSTKQNPPGSGQHFCVP